MAYRILADLVLILHFCFVLFVVFGGLLVIRQRWVALLHLPAVIWGIVVEFFLLACPLTTLENFFRQLGGESGYTDGFINHYISAVLYANISPQFRATLGLLLIGLNVFIYRYVFRQRSSSRFNKIK